MLSSQPNILIVDHKFILKVQNVTNTNVTVKINSKCRAF